MISSKKLTIGEPMSPAAEEEKHVTDIKDMTFTIKHHTRNNNEATTIDALECGFECCFGGGIFLSLVLDLGVFCVFHPEGLTIVRSHHNM